jgi:multiple sugar transport system ATP-binding protein
LLDRRPHQLSGGQQQRVALGRCIVRNPKVFLFDEPLSNLDAQLRAQMRLELKELRLRVPTTSIFVTHDQTEAMTLGDRIVVMKDGVVQQVGAPLELYRKPARRFPDLGSHVGRSICVGVRPQHVRLGAPVNDDQIRLNGTVMVTEQLGDEQLLAVRLGDGEIRIAGVDPDLSLSTGSQIEAAIATDHLHFFDELEQMQ